VASLLFRCDGVKETGLGHVSRCLGLAEALAESDHACRFLGAFAPAARELLERAGVPFDTIETSRGGGQDLAVTLDSIRTHRSLAVVIDSYGVDDNYVASVEQKGAPVLLIDDFARLKRYECSGVLNFTVNASALGYPNRRDQVRALGPGYLLVRRRLRRFRRSARLRDGGAKRILVAMGGIDALDLSGRVMRALVALVKNVTVRVVVGRQYPNGRELSSLIESFGGESRVLVQLPDLAEEFAAADLCICTGGLTKYEAAYMGVPAGVVSATTDQALETRQFAGVGLAADLGWAEQDDADLAGHLENFLHNRSRNAALSQTCLTRFPMDPTRHAADRLIEIAKRRV